MAMFRSGSVRLIVESRIFWLKFMFELIDIPILEKRVCQETDDVRVDCVKA